VLGVSFDSPETNRDFAASNDLPFRLLTDRDRALAKAVGASRALLPLPKRVSYLVGADGRVLNAYPEVDPKTHAAEVIKDLRALVTSRP
jgi:peroxiredoxin Q/BCP